MARQGQRYDAQAANAFGHGRRIERLVEQVQAADAEPRFIKVDST